MWSLLAAVTCGVGLAPGTSEAATGCAPATVSSSLITANETWTAACSPYIVTNYVTVRNGAVLTIEPGVEVRFLTFRTLTISTATQTGGIVAQGTPANPIVFTADAATPVPGSWRGIVIERNALAGSELSNVLIEYAGYYPALRLQQTASANLTISEIEIRDCEQDGISVVGGDVLLDTVTVDCPAAAKHGITLSSLASLVLRDSTISNAMVATHAPIAGEEVSGTTFTSYDSGLPLKLHAERVGAVLGGSQLAGATSASAIEVMSGPLPGDATWPAYTYRILGHVYVNGVNAPVLTLLPGAELRFSSSAQLFVGTASKAGGLSAVGTSANPIRFRSNTTPAGPGQWKGIELGADALATTHLEHVVFQNSGPGPALKLLQAGPGITIRNGEIESCNGEGIEIFGGEATIESFTIDCSAGSDYGVLATSSSVTLTGSSIRNGINLLTALSASVSGNTFVDYDSGKPLNLAPSYVSDVLGSNVLDGATSASVVDVGSTSALKTSGQWPAFDYRIAGVITIAGELGPILELAAGAVLRFPANGQLMVGTTQLPGGLVALGTQAAPVKFISSKASPVPGDWRGISLGFHALDDTLLRWVEIRHAGTTAGAALSIAYGDVTVENSLIEDSLGDGISIRDSSPVIRETTIRDSSDDGIDCTQGGVLGFRPRVIASTIEDNTDRGIVCRIGLELVDSSVSGSSVGVHITSVDPLLRLRRNDLSGNSVRAIQNDDTGDGMDARLNWLGTATAPQSQVQGDVLLRPWLGAAPNPSLGALEGTLSPESFGTGGGTSTLAAQLSATADWTLEIRDSVGTLMRSFSGSGNSVSQAWDGTDSGATTVADGVYTFELDASISGGAVAAPVVGTVTVGGAGLAATIADPTPFEVVPGASLSVSGTANGTGFTSYTLDYAEGGDPTPTSFTTIAQGSTAVSGGTLGSWNTSALLKGVYTLRLRSFGSGGVSVEDRATVHVLAVYGPTYDEYLSPNADLLKDSAVLEAKATVNAPWTLSVLDGSSQVVRTFTGDGTVIRARWDGRNTAGTVLADGAYTYQVEVGGGIDSIVGGPTNLDTTPPSAAFSSPASGSSLLTYDPVSIVGTADDPHLERYRLTYRFDGVANPIQIGSSTSPVVSGLLGILPGHGALDPTFVDETLTLTLSVDDLAGNSASTEMTLLPDLITITSVSGAPKVIDPYAGQSTSISYTINRPADVTIEFYESGSWEQSLALAATILNGAPREAGSHSEVWNGADEASGNIPAMGGYYFSIAATDGAGRTARFNDPAAPAGTPFSVGYPGLKINGVPQYYHGDLGAEVVDAYRNDEFEVEFLPSLDGRVSRYSLAYWPAAAVVLLSDGTKIPIPGFDSFPSGVPARAYWDGRRPDGSIVDLTFDLVISTAVTAEDHIIFLKHDFRLEDVRTNPYVFHPSLAGATNVKFGLSEPAQVTIDVIDPNGNFLFTLLDPTVLPTGEHEVTWDGKLPLTDEAVSLEGVYTLEVRATTTLTNQSHTRRVSALVYR